MHKEEEEEEKCKSIFSLFLFTLNYFLKLILKIIIILIIKLAN